MDHDLAYAAIIYLASFRLAIIAVGGLSIVLGYQLFAKGLFPEQTANSTTFQAELGKTKFSLKNAAPGTFFALFGVIIISMMLLNAPAEVNYSKNNGGETIQGESKAEPTAVSKESFKMRGAKDNRQLALDLNALAWVEYDAKNYKKAVAFSRLSLHLDAGNAKLMDTLATMLSKVERHKEALEYKIKAASLDVEKYGKGIQAFRDAAK